MTTTDLKTILKSLDKEMDKFDYFSANDKRQSMRNEVDSLENTWREGGYKKEDAKAMNKAEEKLADYENFYSAIISIQNILTNTL